MTVPVQNPSITYVGNGATNAFAFPFTILESSDLIVLLDGVEQTVGVQYTIDGIGNQSGGTATFLSNPTAGANISLYRDVSIERDTDYQDNGDLLAKTVNSDFDRLWMAMQDGNSGLTRAVRVPRSDISPNMTLPPASQRMNKAFGFDNLGNPFMIALTIGAVVAPVVANVASARLVTGNFTAVFALGFDDAGDGGGGDYYPDRADTTSPDDGGSCLITVEGVRIKLRSHSFLSSKQMGVFSYKTPAWNRQQMQRGINAGFGKFLFDCRNSGDIIQIDGSLTIPLQMEIESNTRWAGTIQQTALDQPIFVVGAAAADVTIDNIHLSYSGTPISGADAIRLNGCFAFSARNLWISSCWNGVYALSGGNHEFIGLRIFLYENCAMLLSAAIDVNTTDLRFHAGDSIKGRNGGIRLEGPCEGCTFSQGDVTLGQYGITTGNFGSNARGQAPYFNRFFGIYFDSAKTYPGFLDSCCDTDFVACWFASAGHDEAIGFGSALPNPGVFATKCIDLVFQGGNFENNGGPGAQVYADCVRPGFYAGARFKHNQYSRTADGEGLQFLPGLNDFNVIGCHFFRDPDQTTYRQRYSVGLGAGASQGFDVSHNKLGGCALNINTSADPSTYNIVPNF